MVVLLGHKPADLICIILPIFVQLIKYYINYVSKLTFYFNMLINDYYMHLTNLEIMWTFESVQWY